MPISLVDIVPQKRTVQLAAGELELRGLGLRQIAHLFLQFPSLQNWFTEGAPAVDPVELINLLPDAVATVIAEAADQPNALEVLASGGVITPDEAYECISVIFDLTFPRGVVPLLQKLTALVGRDAALGPVVGEQGGTGQSVPRNSSPPDMMAAQ
jgi:hypothetical protein